MLRLLLMTDFSESYANKLLEGIVRYSYQCTPCVVCKMPLSVPAAGGLGKVLEFALQWHADAIIGQFKNDDDVDMFRRNGIVAVAQDYRLRFSTISNITANYNEEGRKCARYMINLGAKNFAFYGLRGSVWSDERRDGFLQQIRDDVKNATISVKERTMVNDAWWYDIGEVRSWLMQLPKPVAILACDDNMAYHIIEACQQGSSGMRIPNDIMLLGVDNDESLCKLCSPTLSSFAQQVEQAGFNTAMMIDKRMQLPLEQRFDVVEDVLVQPGAITIRKSTDVFLHDNPYIKKVCTYIQQHLTENIMIDDLVDQVPMSRRLLEQIFRAEIGVSIHQYILRMRVDRMKSLMNDRKTAQEAAQELGLDFKTISRSFKNITGETPVEYYKKLLQ